MSFCDGLHPLEEEVPEHEDKIGTSSYFIIAHAQLQPALASDPR
jgi:hypothetical protein